MKWKNITTSVLLACLSKPNNRKKDIHTKLKETIAEHRKIMREFEKLSKEQHDLFVNIDKVAA
jgi:hypothetical protein